MKRFLYELTESWKIAAAQMRSNKTRSTLTALGVIIGIVAVTLMGTAIERHLDRIRQKHGRARRRCALRHAMAVEAGGRLVELPRPEKNQNRIRRDRSTA